MNILLLYDFDLSLSKGYSINERESVRSLKKMLGDQIIVVAPMLESPSNFDDVSIEYYYNPKRYNVLHYLVSLFSCYKVIKRILQKQKIDAIVTRLPLIPIVPYLFQKHDIPIILKKLAGFSLFESDRRGWKTRLLSVLAKPLYVSIIKNCLGADVESNTYVKWASSNFSISEEKIEMVPNGVNVNSFIPFHKKKMRKLFNLDQFKYLIGYVGAIDELRNISLAIKCMRILLELVPNAGMVLVGAGHSYEKIRELVQRHNMGNHVCLTGFLPYQKIPQIISSFDVAFDLTYVPLSLPKGTLGASYSQKIPQYLACGVPVVAWDTEDTQFLRQKKVGSIVPYGSIHGLAEAFKDHIEEPKDIISDKCRKCALNLFSTDILSLKRILFWESIN